MSDPSGTPPMRTRPIRWREDGTVHPEDLEAITRVLLEAQASVLPVPDLSVGEIERMLAFPSVDRDACCLALDRGDVVGVLRIEADPNAALTRIDACSVPWPESVDLRGQLLERGLAIARQHQARKGEPGWKARAGASITDAAYLDVLRSRGMTPIRRFYRMGIDSESPVIPGSAPALPDGMAIVKAYDEATRRSVHAVDMAAFADHWGHHYYAYDDWVAFVSVLSADPDDWWLLTVDGAPAAICILDDRKAAQVEGYVAVLAVLKEFRGRGLAQLLLQRAFVHYRDVGRRGTCLNVDATNTTGAVALYEKVGMVPVVVREAYEHTLD